MTTLSVLVYFITRITNTKVDSTTSIELIGSMMVKHWVIVPWFRDRRKLDPSWDERKRVQLYFERTDLRCCALKHENHPLGCSCMMAPKKDSLGCSSMIDLCRSAGSLCTTLFNSRSHCVLHFSIHVVKQNEAHNHEWTGLTGFQYVNLLDHTTLFCR